MSERLSKLRHDLRTPLNQIIGYSELLLEDAPAELRPDLQRIHSAALAELSFVEEAIGLLTARPGELPAPAESPPALAAEAAEPDSVQGAGEPLLVVDDDEPNREMLARRLKRSGYAVDTAASGGQALEMISRRAYSLVVLDIMMPGMSGLEVLRRLRATHPMAELPVIMASAKDASEDVIEALGLGANDYVTKPINLPVLLARCRTQLEALRAHRFIRSVFGRYLTDEVVDTLLSAPEALALGGEGRVVTVLMADLRGFSTLCERLSPAQVISLINVYLGRMTDVICAHGGTIAEFIGDAILAIFGAPLAQPEHAGAAVRCALQMQLAMGGVNACLERMGLPAIEMGVGLNTGEVVVGNIGSERRAKYDVIGRNVNLASRIQAFSVGGEVLASQATLDASGGDARVDWSLEVLPKGSDVAMRLYALGALGEVELPRVESALVALPRGYPVTFRILDSVHVTDAERAGTITHLSAGAARVEAAAPVAVPCTLMFQLPEGALYAKVRTAEQDGRVLLAHLSPSSAAVERALAALRQGG